MRIVKQIIVGKTDLQIMKTALNYYIRANPKNSVPDRHGFSHEKVIRHEELLERVNQCLDNLNNIDV